MSQTIFFNGSFAMRVERKELGVYRIMANMEDLVRETFFMHLRQTYDIEEPVFTGENATFTLRLRLEGFVFERNHIIESLGNIFECSLAIHKDHFFFKPRTAW